MKTTNRFLTALVVMLLLFNVQSIQAQDDAPKRPDYFSVTTMYWNSDYDGTMDEWKAMESEYKEKVTKKNEHIMSASYQTHLMTPNSNEVVYIQVYPTWEDIDLAAARSAELEKEAWPDDEARRAFLTKMNSAFSDYHSDEIYAIIDGAILPSDPMTKDMVVYLRKNKFAFPDDGSGEEYGELNKKYLDNVIGKNEFIKAYYPSVHAWGHDRRDFNEYIVLDSLGDLDKLFTRSSELMNEAFTKEEAQAYGKYFKSHGDYVYTAIKL